MRRLPWWTLSLVVSALAIGLCGWVGCGWEPGAAWWRLLTAQLSHWDGNHLAWDALALAGLGGYAEWHWPRAWRRAVAIALLLVPALVVLAHPQIAFRGLSGLACTAATVIAVQAWREAVGDRWGRLLAAALLLGLVLKILVEMASGTAIFAAATTWFPLPIAHLAGLLAGLLGAWGRLDPPCSKYRTSAAVPAAGDR